MTESLAMLPAASVSGLYFANPEAKVDLFNNPKNFHCTVVLFLYCVLGSCKVAGQT